jgi:hypothetical protein
MYLSYPFICLRTLQSIIYLGYCEYCCHKHGIQVSVPNFKSFLYILQSRIALLTHFNVLLQNEWTKFTNGKETVWNFKKLRQSKETIKGVNQKWIPWRQERPAILSPENIVFRDRDQFIYVVTHTFIKEFLILTRKGMHLEVGQHEGVSVSVPPLLITNTTSQWWHTLPFTSLMKWHIIHTDFLYFEDYFSLRVLIKTHRHEWCNKFNRTWNHQTVPRDITCLL